MILFIYDTILNEMKKLNFEKKWYNILLLFASTAIASIIFAVYVILHEIWYVMYTIIVGPNNYVLNRRKR